MLNSVIQALLTRIRLIKEGVIFSLHYNFSIIWNINYKASVIGSNIQYDVMKQPGETFSAG